MTTLESVESSPEKRYKLKPEHLLILSGWGLVFLTYMSAFLIFGSDSLLAAFKRASINTVPAALLSLPIFQLIDRKIVAAHPGWQFAAHFLLAIAYSFLWYVGIQVGYGLQSGWASAGIIGRPLVGAALAWQMFQGVTLYAAIAGFAYAHHFRARWQELKSVAPVAEPVRVAKRIMIRDGKSIRPVDLEDIFCLSGAGDYTEVVTRNETILSSTALSTFEEELPGRLFLRVHRSHIVRMEAILSVESAGNGRLTLHLPKGHSVTTSRAGAAEFRDRAL